MLYILWFINKHNDGGISLSNESDLPVTAYTVNDSNANDWHNNGFAYARIMPGSSNQSIAYADVNPSKNSGFTLCLHLDAKCQGNSGILQDMLIKFNIVKDTKINSYSREISVSSSGFLCNGYYYRVSAPMSCASSLATCNYMVQKVPRIGFAS